MSSGASEAPAEGCGVETSEAQPNVSLCEARAIVRGAASTGRRTWHRALPWRTSNFRVMDSSAGKGSGVGFISTPSSPGGSDSARHDGHGEGSRWREYGVVKHSAQALARPRPDAPPAPGFDFAALPQAPSPVMDHTRCRDRATTWSTTSFASRPTPPISEETPARCNLRPTKERPGAPVAAPSTCSG